MSASAHRVVHGPYTRRPPAPRPLLSLSDHPTSRATEPSLARRRPLPPAGGYVAVADLRNVRTTILGILESSTGNAAQTAQPPPHESSERQRPHSARSARSNILEHHQHHRHQQQQVLSDRPRFAGSYFDDGAKDPIQPNSIFLAEHAEDVADRVRAARVRSGLPAESVPSDVAALEACALWRKELKLMQRELVRLGEEDDPSSLPPSRPPSFPPTRPISLPPSRPQSAIEMMRRRRLVAKRLWPSDAGAKRQALLPPPPRLLGPDLEEIAAASAELTEAISAAKAALSAAAAAAAAASPWQASTPSRKQKKKKKKGEEEEEAAQPRPLLRDFECADDLRAAIARAHAADGVDALLLAEGAAQLEPLEEFERLHRTEVREASEALHAALATDDEQAISAALPAAQLLSAYLEPRGDGSCLLDEASAKLEALRAERAAADSARSAWRQTSRAARLIQQAKRHFDMHDADESGAISRAEFVAVTESL